ncbi:MAG TPA: LysE family transporter [Rhizomicrobium sp.]|jgi:threonine/homoserine/homoserine lactone efflux protein
MMTAGTYIILIVSGFVIGLIAAVPIGPVNMLCIRRTFAYGSLYGFLSGLGAALADGVFAAIVGFGLTTIAQMIQTHFTPIEIVGGLMLLGFGVHSFMASPNMGLDEKLKAREKNGRATLARAMASTFALAITNPATLFSFTGMFAAVAGLVGGQASYFGTLLLVCGVLAGSTTWWFTLTTITGLFHAKIDARIMGLINRISGGVVTLFGVLILGDVIRRIL